MNLFPHNREAYENAANLFKTENRACIIQPTGTGKSVIIAEFINRNPESRHLLLAPGAHIFQEIGKHAKGGIVSFSTYIGLRMNDCLFLPDSFDYIYLDEFHRLGAEVWGGCVERLLGLNPHAKVLGTSATHIRYLDDSRNMATEIFNENIATQLSLNSAIAQGILPSPKYVSALYSIQAEFQHMQRKIRSSKTGNKDTLLRELDSRIIDWERSSGLDVVIKRHLDRSRRRVIVFCKDWEHTNYAQNMLDPIFKEIYGQVECRSLYAKKSDGENEAVLRMFTAEDDKTMVLYTIDKVNEGLHVKNCGTVILLRDTISPIVFYQQIGRAFSVSGGDQPLIVDLVNNFKNIQIVSFKQDFDRELGFLNKRNGSGEGETRKAAIEFIDETQDIRDVFYGIEMTIDEWQKKYELAKAYFNEHGHLYFSAADRQLLVWGRSQKKEYQRGRMSKVRIAKLRAIGMDLDGEIPARWMAVVFELEAWKKKNGSLPGFEENVRLYSWMTRQRKAFQTGELTDKQVEILRKLIKLEGDTRVKERVGRLVRHFRNDNGSPFDEAIKYDLLRIRDLYKLKRLPEVTVSYLRNGNVPIDGTLKDVMWLENMKKVIDMNSAGRTPRHGVDEDLYHFCIRERGYLNQRHPRSKYMRQNKEAGKLLESFQKIIVTMAKPDWDDQCAALREIVEKYGRVSSDNCDEHLMQWMWRQRRFLRDGKLSPEKIKKLLTIEKVDWYYMNSRASRDNVSMRK